MIIEAQFTGNNNSKPCSCKWVYTQVKKVVHVWEVQPRDTKYYLGLANSKWESKDFKTVGYTFVLYATENTGKVHSWKIDF